MAEATADLRKSMTLTSGRASSSKVCPRMNPDILAESRRNYEQEAWKQTHFDIPSSVDEVEYGKRVTRMVTNSKHSLGTLRASEVTLFCHLSVLNKATSAIECEAAEWTVLDLQDSREGNLNGKCLHSSASIRHLIPYPNHYWKAVHGRCQ